MKNKQSWIVTCAKGKLSHSGLRIIIKMEKKQKQKHSNYKYPQLTEESNGN